MTNNYLRCCEANIQTLSRMEESLVKGKNKPRKDNKEYPSSNQKNSHLPVHECYNESYPSESMKERILAARERKLKERQRTVVNNYNYNDIDSNKYYRNQLPNKPRRSTNMLPTYNLINDQVFRQQQQQQEEEQEEIYYFH